MDRMQQLCLNWIAQFH